PVGHARVQLARRRPPRVVAVVGDEPLDVAQLVAVGQVVLAAAEGEAVAVVADPHDRLHGLAGHVAAQHHHVRPVRGAGVQELAEALLRAVHVRGEEQLDLPGHAYAARDPSRAAATSSTIRAARSGSTGFQVSPSTLRLVPTIAPSTRSSTLLTVSWLTPVLASTGMRLTASLASRKSAVSAPTPAAWPLIRSA